MHAVHTESLSKSAKRAHWDAIITDYLSSDEGMSVYSKRHGLRYDHLSYYVSAYRRKQRKNQSDQFISLGSVSTPTNEKIIINIGPVTVEFPASTSEAALITIIKGLSC